MTSRYRLALRERARVDDGAFAEYVSDIRFPGFLRDASRFADRNPRAILLAPRGFAKTTAAIHRAARIIGLTEGRERLGILTAVDADAERRSGAIRHLVESPRYAEVYPWAQAGVEGRSWRDDVWSVRGTDHGKDATCTAMSLGSVRAGPRLDMLLADDPVGLQENATPAGRARALETYLGVVEPMLVPGAHVLILGTRWHEDDLYAYLIRAGWPALVRRAVEDGIALWPERFPLAELAARQALMGTPLFNLQYQNDPAGMGGNVFRREWFRYVDVVPPGLVRRVGIDLAGSSSERSDYTAVVELVEAPDRTLFVVGVWRARLGEGHRAWITGRTDPFERAIAPALGPPVGPRLCWPLGLLPGGFAGATGDPALPRRLAAVNIESGAFQTVFAGELLRQTGLPAVPVRPDHDKVTRARPLAARYESGKVFHLRGAPGLAEFEDELVAFPNGAHDDQVDAAVYAADLGAVAPVSVFSMIEGPALWSLNRSELQRRARPSDVEPPGDVEPPARRVRMGI